MAQPLGGVARTKLCLVTPPPSQVDGRDQRCEYLGNDILIFSGQNLVHTRIIKGILHYFLPF